MYGRLSGSSYHACSCEKWVLYWLIDIVYLHPNFLHLRVLKGFERLLVYLSHKSDQLMSKVSFLVGLDIQWTGYRKIPDDKFLLVLEFLTDCVLLHKLNRPIERFFLRSNKYVMYNETQSYLKSLRQYYGSYWRKHLISMEIISTNRQNVKVKCILINMRW